MAVHGTTPKRKEIYKYEAPWPLYSMNWSVRPDKRYRYVVLCLVAVRLSLKSTLSELYVILLFTLYRLALGSFVEEYNNKVQIVSLDEDTSEFSAKSTFDHPYPTTKIMWIPDSVSV